MKTVLYLIQKEFLQIFRNKAMLPIIVVMPIIQLVILAHAVTYEIRNIQMTVVGHDLSTTSRLLISKFDGSPFFEIESFTFNTEEAKRKLDAGTTDLVLYLPNNFEHELLKNDAATVFLELDAINGIKAGVAQNYAHAILADFNRQLRAELLHIPPGKEPMEISIVPAYWFNPALDYQTFMVPGILVLLVTMIGAFLSGMNIVKEKEMGTIEQLNVTPIRKHHFIIGKLLPFWIIGLVELAVGMVIGVWLFDIPIVGSLWLIFGFSALYLTLILGLGLLISTVTETQQQSMFISWFVLVLFILMSGLFTPIESMPRWAQQITLFNPIRYFVEVIRMVMLKGSGFGDITTQLTIIGLYSLGLNALAVVGYRKRV